MGHLLGLPLRVEAVRLRPPVVVAHRAEGVVVRGENGPRDVGNERLRETDPAPWPGRRKGVGSAVELPRGEHTRVVGAFGLGSCESKAKGTDRRVVRFAARLIGQK